MSGLLFTLIVIYLLLFGAPVFIVILFSALYGFYLAEIDFSIITLELFRIAETPLLLALPFFTLAGYILSESKSSSRLVRLTQSIMGWMPGGLAIIAFICCALFTAFTGASGVTIVALGALLYPALKEVGYPERFSLGLVATSGSLGLLLAPSLPLILYGIIAQQMNPAQNFSIQQLFLAGIFPSIVMIVLLSGWSIWANRKINIPKRVFSTQELVAAVKEAKWDLPLPFIVVGGIYGGLFAISETAAVTLLYVLIVQIFVYKEVTLKQLPKIVRQSMAMVGGIILILGVSLALANALVDAEIPTRAFELIQLHIHSKLSFLILLNLFLLMLGAILDIFSAIVIVVPIILPVAEAYGVHPVHLGIIFLANMQIGYLTPPVGMNLFIASYRFKKPITELYHAALPFMFILLLALMIITYVPALSLALL